MDLYLGNSVMNIVSSKVGIGITSPGSTLQVNSSLYTDTVISVKYNTNPGTLGGTLHVGPYFDFYTPDYYGSSFKCARIAGGCLSGGGTSGGLLQFLVSQGDGAPAPTPVMTLNTSGYVGVGTTTLSQILQTSINASSTTAGTGSSLILENTFVYPFNTGQNVGTTPAG
jgi:hypothetical protein